jgi:hypothetical protein
MRKKPWLHRGADVTDVCMDAAAVSSNVVMSMLLDGSVVKEWCKSTTLKITSSLAHICILNSMLDPSKCCHHALNSCALIACFFLYGWFLGLRILWRCDYDLSFEEVVVMFWNESGVSYIWTKGACFLENSCSKWGGSENCLNCVRRQMAFL